MSDWGNEDVTSLKGVGSKLAERLNKIGIFCLQDMLFHLPLRYEDRTRLTSIGSLQQGRHYLIQGQVLLASVNFRPGGRSRRSLVVSLTDNTGQLSLRFFYFNARQQQQLSKGAWIRCFGECRWIGHNLEMVHPEYELIDPESPPQLQQRLTAVYSTTEGLHQLSLRRIFKQLLIRLQQQPISEPLPEIWVQKHKLPEINLALIQLHSPQNAVDVSQILSMSHPSQRRFIIEELAAHRLSLLQKRQQIRQLQSVLIEISNLSIVSDFLSNLPFTLTTAQQRVLDELMNDFQADGKPMLRLMQGDVGSGKTVVAAASCVVILQNGFQCALMAPTEILAEQHYQNFKTWLQPMGFSLVLLTGADKGKNRQQKLDDISSGKAQLIIGTHALFQGQVEYFHLAYLIIDEQHRFGVAQRQALQKKARQGETPHQLIMSATPIPRTLAMSLFADLDYSVIDELPPGRKPVNTSVIIESKRSSLIESVRKSCASGAQVYWVCTLIEESEALQCEAAELSFSNLEQQLPECHVDLVHGRLKAEQKEQRIHDFKQGKTQILVATTVIEVGVDVPNASIMIIENPERLGLAQIHQLRGRVGRGAKESFCILLVKNNISGLARKRLNIIRNTNDGFEIAQKDLELRGAGEYMGTRQTGEARYKIADLLRDEPLFPLAQELAELLLERENESQGRQLIQRWIGLREGFSEIA